MGDELVCGSINYAEQCLPSHREELMCSSEMSEGTTGTMRLPLDSPAAANSFLQGIGSGSAGAGHAMSRIGVNAPAVRAAYKQRVESMVAEIARRVDAGESAESVARWVSAERNSILSDLRKMTGAATQPLYAIRDWREYGMGGRTWDNITRRYQQRGYTGSAMHQEIIEGALRSNTDVNNAAMNGAKFLKHGGRVVMVVGVAISAARIWNATDEELPRVIGEEIGGVAGGALGAGAGVAACIIFGIATSGWGLLACGLVGGVGGGVAGSYAGREIADGIYYSDADTPADMMGEISIEIPYEQLYPELPPHMCMKPL